MTRQSRKVVRQTEAARAAAAIRCTLGDLVRAEEPLTRALTMAPTALGKYQVAHLLRLVRQETADYHTEHAALVKAHGDERPAMPDEEAQFGPSVFTVRPDRMVEFAAQLKPLLDIRVEIACPPIALSALDPAISGPDVDALWPLLAAPVDATLERHAGEGTS